MSNNADSPSLSYKDAGVDIAAGNALVDNIKHSVASTRREGVMGSIGGFGGLFELPLDRYQHPVLVSGTDGVGTKLKLAIDLQRYDSIGIDLVAMCVNDILVLGAEPLFFLDYYATGKLDNDIASSVISGIAEGCRQSGAALIGGETAEMPGMYQADDFDLAGFCVGIVEKDRIIDGSSVVAGDAIIALASSGPHSNGYSLVRKIIEHTSASLSDPLADGSLGDALLAPTRIYANSLAALGQAVDIHAMAHITGGGLLENIPRVLPENTRAELDLNSWQLPPVFQWLQQGGNVTDTEMQRTFNCGVGMTVILKPEDVDTALQVLADAGETAWLLGSITEHQGKAEVVFS